MGDCYSRREFWSNVAASPVQRSTKVRASTHSPFPPVIFATLWNHQEYVAFVPYLKKLEILKQSADAKVIYEQIKMPFLSLIRTTR